MVTIITLTGRGHEQETLSLKDALRRLIANRNRYLIIDWRTQEVIHKDALQSLADDAVVGLIPQIAGGSQSAIPFFWSRRARNQTMRREWVFIRLSYHALLRL